MGAQLARRGPDDERFFDDGALGLVFRRLSIIDIAGGAQPLWNERKDILLVVNGEIYNHRDLRARLTKHHFATASDSEVVLHLYEELGEAAFEQLDGIFSVALWLQRSRKLVLARDRFGVKPLFLAETAGDLLFGSEMKALLVHSECPRSVDWAALPQKITGVPIGKPAPTAIRGIRQLPPGHVGVFENGNLAVKPYWSPEAAIAAREEPRERAWYVSRYADLLEEAVQKQLMSDVPVGTFLSGGLDSCLVTALAARHRADITGFNWVDPGVFASGDTAAARALCDQEDIPLHQVPFEVARYGEPGPLTLEHLEYLVWALEKPYFNLEWYYKHELHRFARTLRPDMKVLLLGQGADEFAGGYSRSWEAPTADWQGFLSRELHLIVPVALLDLLSPKYLPLRDHSPWSHDDVARERCATLEEYNLWHEDRTSSAQGREARVPFLDHHLVEHCLAVPPGLQPSLFWDKQIVREAAARWLPPELCNRRKVGFYTSPDLSPLAKVWAGAFGKVFPEFLEKYASSADSMLSADRLRARVLRIFGGGIDPACVPAEMDRMASLMALAIFEWQARELRKGWLPSMVDAPSPLRSVSAAELHSLFSA